MTISLAALPMRVASFAPVAVASPVRAAAASFDAGTPAVSRSQLIRQFSDLRSQLERWDADFTRWENHGRTYPNQQAVTTFNQLATRVDEARIGLMRTGLTEKGVAALGADSRSIAFAAGQMRVMANNQITFGGGWSRLLDTPIENARRAIDLLSR